MNDLGVVRPIPVLTLWEPWLTLMILGFKPTETRHWHTKVRGPVALHAAQKKVRDVDPELAALCDFAIGPKWRDKDAMPLGCVRGVGQLTGCFSAHHLVEGRPPLLAPVSDCDHISGNYERGRFGFRFETVRPLADPLPLKSRQTPFWSWVPPADLEARLLPAVDQVEASRRWEARHG